MYSILEKYFPELSGRQLDQFKRMEGLYREWNSRINVISRRDMDHFYERHVLHSLGLAKIITFVPGTKILDAGTGGGFPGIPLAVLFPECEFLLADSIGKKIGVVNEISKALNLKNITARQVRVEKLNEKFDFVLSRAVTSFPEFLKWVGGKILKNSFNSMPNGIFCFKGGDLKSELGAYYSDVSIFELGNMFEEEFFKTKRIVYYPCV